MASGVKLDIRRLRPGDVVSIAISPEKQDQQNVRKLKSMNSENWAKLVDEIHREGNNADPDVLRPLLRLEAGQEMELYAARANMAQIVHMLHDPSSAMLDMLLVSLAAGKLCVLDVSQMRGAAGLVLSGLVLSKIFNHNQEQFTVATPETIPTIAVVEEAQSILGSEGNSGEGPYISWVKEGRKYDLGAVLITQQPGSIPSELLSQGDNWFIFHLLSAGDLFSVKKANAHFSDDILSSLLNEPIVGQGVFWSSVGSSPYPVPLRIMSFEKMYQTRDEGYVTPAAGTYAEELRTKFGMTSGESAEESQPSPPSPETGVEVPEESVDRREAMIQAAILQLKNDRAFIDSVRSQGATWWKIQKHLADSFPDYLPRPERGELAYQLMRQALNEVFGAEGWYTEKGPRPGAPPGEVTTWVKVRPGVGL